MDACADYCQKEAETIGEGKYCCDFLDNTRVTDATTTDTTTDRNTNVDTTTDTTTKSYNSCWLFKYSEMQDSRTHMSYKFKT